MSERALVIDLGCCRAAIALHELVEVHEHPDTTHLPSAPGHCDRLLYRDSGPVPVFDIPKFLGMVPARASHGFVVVLAFRLPHDDAVRFGGLWARQLPEPVALPAISAVSLPAPAWAPLALSCFERDGQSIPIIAAGRVFARPTADVGMTD